MYRLPSAFLFPKVAEEMKGDKGPFRYHGDSEPLTVSMLERACFGWKDKG